MPWAIADVDRHVKGLTLDEKKQWVEVANSVLADTGDEGEAILRANGVIKRRRHRGRGRSAARWYHGRLGPPPSKGGRHG